MRFSFFCTFISVLPNDFEYSSFLKQDLQEMKIQVIKYLKLSCFKIFSIHLFSVKHGQFKQHNYLCKSNKNKYSHFLLILCLVFFDLITLKIRINFVFLQLVGSIDIVFMFYDTLEKCFESVKGWKKTHQIFFLFHVQMFLQQRSFLMKQMDNIFQESLFKFSQNRKKISYLLNELGSLFIFSLLKEFVKIPT